MKIKIKKLVEHAIIPTYAHEGDAGMDIYAAEWMVIPHGEHRLIKTGISIALPTGYEAQIRSRSGLAAKQGMYVLNSPGTIDCGYRGEVGVILANLDHKVDVGNGQLQFAPYTVNIGDRIAQMVIAPITKAQCDVVDELDETDRGIGGFGSTGK